MIVVARCIEIEGAKELLEQVQNDIGTLDTSIAELNAKKAELEKVIEESEGNFTVGVLTGKINATHELNMLNQTLLDAEKARRNLAGIKLYRKAEKILLQHRDRVNTSYNDKIKAIIEKLYELRFLYNELKDYDRAEFANIKEFIHDIGVYLEEDIEELGNANPIIELTGVPLKRDDKYSTNRVIDVFPDTAYGVEGGLFAPSSKVDNTRTLPDGNLVSRAALSNKKYNVNPDEIRDRLQREREEIPEI